MDMWRPYFTSTVRYVPGATEKIVYDNFHLARYLNRAVDEVRRAEHAAAPSAKASPLKGTRNLWLYGLAQVGGSLPHLACAGHQDGTSLEGKRVVSFVLGQCRFRRCHGVFPTVVSRRLGVPLGTD